MNHFIEFENFVADKEKPPFIFEMMPAELSDVPFHTNTAAITRLFADGFPLHAAVHEVSPVIQPPEEYTQPHVHADSDEVNIIISKRELKYKIQLGDEVYIVNNNACVWIPKGMSHAANVLKGSGYFITLRLN